MGDLTPIDWQVVGLYIERWLAVNRGTDRQFAETAGFHSSELSKLRRGKSVELLTAARIYTVVSPLMTNDERYQFLAELGLSSFAALLIEQPITTGGEPVLAMNTDDIMPDRWHGVRQQVHTWLAKGHITIRNLSSRMGRSPSSLSRFLRGNSLEEATAVKLYEVMSSDMSSFERRDFLKAVGLTAFAFLVRQQAGVSCAVPREAPGASAAWTILQEGRDLARRSWSDAIARLRSSENTVRGETRPAIESARLIAQCQINLGEYGAALQTIRQIEAEYRPELEFPDSTDLCRMRAWISLYIGHFQDSERYFLECLRRTRIAGDVVAEAGVHHFLGRVYADWSVVQPEARAEVLLARAESEFNQAWMVRKRVGSDGDRAFDLLRRAQMLRIANAFPDAEKMLAQARTLFSGDLATTHIDLEMAKLASYRDELRRATKFAERGIRSWGDMHYSKGIAEGTRILGDVACIRQSWREAIEWYVAALCIYPQAEATETVRTWHEMNFAYNQLGLTTSRLTRFSMVQDIAERLAGAEGRFELLRHVAGDRNDAVSAVLARLYSGR